MLLDLTCSGRRVTGRQGHCWLQTAKPSCNHSALVSDLKLRHRINTQPGKKNVATFLAIRLQSRTGIVQQLYQKHESFSCTKMVELGGWFLVQTAKVCTTLVQIVATRKHGSNVHILLYSWLVHVLHKTCTYNPQAIDVQLALGSPAS